jgi:hypothetical protein
MVEEKDEVVLGAVTLHERNACAHDARW